MPIAASRTAVAGGVAFRGRDAAWGEERLTLDFPGGPYVVEGLDPRGAAIVRERYGPLCTGRAAGPTRPPARLRLRRARPGELVPPVGPPKGVHELAIEHAPGVVRLDGRGWKARLRTESPVEGEILLAEAVPDDLVAVVENTLRVMAAYRLHRAGGVLLHSAGVVSNGRAYLFVGRSGAGKTTFARRSLSEGRAVLSDDLNAILPGSGGLRVRQVPFAGELGVSPLGGARRDYPLAGIYGLAHLADAEAPAVVSPLPPSEALGLLLCAASGVNGDPERREELLDALGRLLSVVRRGRVAFSVRGRVWDVLEGAEP